MEVLETQVYRGANYWAPVPVIRFLLDIGELEERPTNQIPGFYEKLTTTLPTMYDHRCSVGKPGGFFQRLREGTWMGHVVEHTTLELQNLAGQEVGYGKARSATGPGGAKRPGVYHVVFQYEQEDVGIAAGKLAIRLCESFIWPERDRVGRLLTLVAQNPGLLGLGIDEDTAALIDADGILEVLGRGSVMIIDGAHMSSDVVDTRAHRPISMTDVVLHALADGYRFNLGTRRPLPAPPVRLSRRDQRRLERAGLRLQAASAADDGGPATKG